MRKNFLLLSGLIHQLFAATFTVTNNNDSGAGSFRQAILDSNASGTSDTINFDAVGTVTLSSDLTITKGSGLTLDINGAAQTLSAGGVAITCDGEGTVNFDDLTFTANTLNVSNGTMTYSTTTITTTNTNLTSATLDIGGAAGIPRSSIGNLSGDASSIYTPRSGGFSNLPNTLDTTFSGTMNGTGLPVKTSTGKLTLSGTNTFTGRMVIDNGTLSVTDQNQLGSNAELRFGAAAFTSNLEITSSATFTKTFNLESGSGIIVPTGITTTISGQVQNLSGGPHTLTKSGDGTMILSSTSNGSSGWLLTYGAGTVQISSESNLGTGTQTFNGGTLETTNGSPITLGRTFALSAGGGTINTSGAGSVTISTAVTGSGDLTKTGSSTLAFTNNGNNYSGSTTISAGMFQAGVANAFSANSAFTLADVASAILDLNNFDNTILSLAGGGSTGGNITLGSGTLTVGDSNSTPYSGAISGTGGGLTKQGSGTLTLNGSSANTFTGLTTVNEGTLLLQKTGVNAIGGDAQINGGTMALGAAGQFPTTSTVTLNSGAFDMDGNATTIATFVFNAGTFSQGGETLTLASNSNALTMRNTTISGDLSLTGGASKTIVFDNTNDGTATISGGLNLGSSATTLDIASGIASTDMLISGTITATAGMTKTGAGTLELSADNSVTYLGNTALSAGAISLGHNNGLGTGTLSMSDSTTLSLANAIEAPNPITLTGTDTVAIASGNATLTGILVGGGGLTKTGSGTLTLTNTHSAYFGDTIVSAGTLLVNGSIVSETTVASGATLGGTGSVGSVTIQSGGTIDPGTSVGTLAVAGILILEAGSTTEIELNPTEASRLNVNALSIGANTTLRINIDPGEYAKNTIYTVLQSTSGFSNKFTTVINTLPAFQVQLVYDTSALSENTFAAIEAPLEPFFFIHLLINVAGFSELVTGGNAGAVAACLDSIPQPEGSDIAFIAELLQFMTISQMTETLEQMNSSLYNALDLTEEETIVSIRSAITRRLADRQRRRCCDLKKNNGWGGFIYSQSHQHSQGGQDGFETRTRSGVVGFDHRFEKAFLGGTFGYAKDNVVWKRQIAKGELNSYAGGFYAGGKTRDVYMQGAVLGFYDDYSGKRKIFFPATVLDALTRTVEYDGMGCGVLSHLELGWIFGKGTVEVHPFGRGDYVYAHRFGFSETGANSIDLDVKKHDADLIRSEVGLQFMKCNQWESDSLWFPHAKISWVYENHFYGKRSKASFIDSSCVMTVSGLDPTRNLVAYSFGLDVRGWGDHFFLGTEFEGEWSNDYWNYSFEAQFKLSF